MDAKVLATGLIFLALAGCAKKEAAPAAEAFGPFSSPGQRGRYVAVGLYTPGDLWEQLRPAVSAQSVQPAVVDPQAASLNDDEQVVVVMDSKTGELRQCGNLSGHCIGFNPWAKPLGVEQKAPVKLVKTAQQLKAEVMAAQEALERDHNKGLAARDPARSQSPAN